MEKNKPRHLINKDVLNEIIANSSICQHADRELRLAGYTPDGGEPNNWMYNQVMEAVALFASHENSGFSAPYEISLVSKLCNFDIVQPLTLADDEFNKPRSYDSVRQNKRRSDIFKYPDGRIRYLYAFEKKPIYTHKYGAKDWENNNSNDCWHGILYVAENDKLTGQAFTKCFIKKEHTINGYYPPEAIIIECSEIEIAKDNWVMVVNVNEPSYKRLQELYDIEYQYAECLKGINVLDVTPELEELAYTF